MGTDLASHPICLCGEELVLALSFLKSQMPRARSLSSHHFFRIEAHTDLPEVATANFTNYQPPAVSLAIVIRGGAKYPFTNDRLPSDDRRF